MNTKKELVSIIITTKNEGRSVGNCLESIKDQSYTNIEIIVVDNYSIDNTKEVSLQFTDKVYNIGPERSVQRNFGIMNVAKGNYFMFIDADMVLNPRLVEEAVQILTENPSMIGLYIPLRWVGKNWIIEARGFEREFYDGTCLDAARFIRRGIFCKTGGFDEKLFAGEDWDLNKRLKLHGEIGITKEVMYHYEDESISLKDYINKMLYYSDNLNLYISKWGWDDGDIRKQFGFYYRSIGVFIEDGKWKKLLSHPFLAINMYLLKLLAMLIFLAKRLSIC
jgi:glycosyltransferase involved in cell wall biosynthesis